MKQVSVFRSKKFYPGSDIQTQRAFKMAVTRDNSALLKKFVCFECRSPRQI